MANKTREFILKKLEKIIDNYMKIEAVREKAIKLNRELLINSSKLMATIYSGDMEKAELYSRNLIKLISTINNELMVDTHGPEEYMFYTKIIRDGLKESVEALLLYIYSREETADYNTFFKNIPDDIFLDGVIEFIGELRRIFLESLRNNEIEKAENALDTIKTIYNNLLSTGIKSFYISNYKRKIDGIRQILLRSIEDYIIYKSSKRGEYDE